MTTECTFKIRLYGKMYKFLLLRKYEFYWTQISHEWSMAVHLQSSFFLCESGI